MRAKKSGQRQGRQGSVMSSGSNFVSARDSIPGNPVQNNESGQQLLTLCFINVSSRIKTGMSTRTPQTSNHLHHRALPLTAQYTHLRHAHGPSPRPASPTVGFQSHRRVAHTSESSQSPSRHKMSQHHKAPFHHLPQTHTHTHARLPLLTLLGGTHIHIHFVVSRCWGFHISPAWFCFVFLVSSWGLIFFRVHASAAAAGVAGLWAELLR